MKNQRVRLGVMWFLISLMVSVGNDTLAKYLGTAGNPLQVTALRFLFGALTLLPFIAFSPKGSMKSQLPWVHVARGILIFLALGLWCAGLTKVPITVATTLTFTIPIFTLVLAPMLLKEQVRGSRWMATLIGFAGALIVAQPSGFSVNSGSAWLMVSAFLFALLDVINKRFVIQESMLAMLFYSTCIAALLSLIPALYVWEPLSMSQWGLLTILGGGNNLILFLLLQAFRYADVSVLSPLRYVELLISAGVGFVIFSEIPSTATLIGLAFIIPSVSFILSEHARKKPDPVALEPDAQQS